MGKCKFPGCGSWLNPRNKTGVCKPHLHSQVCSCSACQRRAATPCETHRRPTRSVTLRLPVDMAEEVAKFAETECVSWAEASRLLIEFGLETLDA